jgi:hypothetical protein
MFMQLNIFSINIQIKCICCWICLNVYAEDSQRHNHPLVEWICCRQSTAQQSKLNGYAEDSQRHKLSTSNRCLCRWTCPAQTFNLDVYMPLNMLEWLCRRQSTISPSNAYAEDSQRHNHPSRMVMSKTVNDITIQLRCLCSWICSA